MVKAESLEKMQQVVDSLRANPDVVIAGGFERNYLETGLWPSPNGYWSRTLDIYTYPKAPMYDAEALNEFMFSLVPELEPTSSNRFSGGMAEDDELELGKLYFDEHIGQAILNATVVLKRDLSVVRSGDVQLTWAANQVLDLQQRTWVRVFPDSGHLADAAEGDSRYRIPVEELGKSDIGRIATNLFQAPLLGGEPEAKSYIDS